VRNQWPRQLARTLHCLSLTDVSRYYDINQLLAKRAAFQLADLTTSGLIHATFYALCQNRDFTYEHRGNKNECIGHGQPRPML